MRHSDGRFEAEFPQDINTPDSASPVIILTPLSHHHSQIRLKNDNKPIIHKEGQERNSSHESQPHRGRTCMVGSKTEEINGISDHLQQHFSL